MRFAFHPWIMAITVLATSASPLQAGQKSGATGNAGSMAIINIAAIIIGPVIAVLITVWWQHRWEQHKEKHDAKSKLFLTLMADRKSSPETYEWVRALNLIDVVFADDVKVTGLWHELFDLMNSPSTPDARGNKLVELLSAMAKGLGFDKLEQVSIGKFHCPQVHIDQLKQQDETQAELLRVLKATEHVWIEPKDDKKAV